LNGYTLFVLIGTVGVFALERVAEFLNLRSVPPAPPAPLAGAYQPDEYARLRPYLTARTRFVWVHETVNLVALLGFWFLGGFAWLVGLAQDYPGGAVGEGLVFFSILFVLRALIGLPFSVYSTFVIEQRFGFNRTTARVFVADLLKGLALGVALGAPLLAGLLGLFSQGGDRAWLWAWAALAVFLVLLQLAVPRWIMPLFNRFTPLEDSALREAIMGYTRSVGVPVRDVCIMDASKRSSKGNAFFTGIGGQRRIALFDTLVERQSAEQILGVVAHEVGHYKGRHVSLGLALTLLHTGLALAAFSWFRTQEALFEAFLVDSPRLYAGLVFFALLIGPVEFLLGLGQQALSRRHEYQADRFAALTTGAPAALGAALLQLSADNLSHPNPHRLYVALNYSHPPLLERLRALRPGRAEESAVPQSPPSSSGGSGLAGTPISGSSSSTGPVDPAR